MDYDSVSFTLKYPEVKSLVNVTLKNEESKLDYSFASKQAIVAIEEGTKATLVIAGRYSRGFALSTISQMVQQTLKIFNDDPSFKLKLYMEFMQNLRRE